MSRGILVPRRQVFIKGIEYEVRPVRFTNKNYFGEPIYINQQTADEEGVKADSPLNVTKKIGGYLAGQASPAWAICKLSNKP